MASSTNPVPSTRRESKPTPSVRQTRKRVATARRANGARANAATPKQNTIAMAASAPPQYIKPPSPEQLMQLQQDYLAQLATLWTDFFQNPLKTSAPINDARFADPAWQSNSLASFYARAYLLNADFMNRLADSVDADRKTKRRVKFAVSQWVDAASPSNFLATNPKAQQMMLDSRGESLRAGLDNLMKDIQRGRISQTDESAFEVGRNVATSEGAVVFENVLFQLIQYKPLTSKVYARPFLVVPPCINKYYILDLQPENSFIRHAVSNGHTVFVVSWKNPHQPESKLTWDDYLEQGAIKALHVAQKITGQKQVNALGFCVGGTILATALAVLYARGETPVSSVTLMTALLDFEDTGALEMFVDEQQVRLREQTIGNGGLMPGRELAVTFNNLRSNDLVWNYVVNNYLHGKQPPAFDLLYWNGDSTNLPGPMYTWYLRNTYLENNLRVPGKVVCAGERVDLNRLNVPTYVFAAREDHIVPWKAAYEAARLLPGTAGHPVRFVLGASGHIAGSINPPSKNKRSYWASKRQDLPADPEVWFASAVEQPGSWWTDWAKWMAQFSGAQIAAPKAYGSAKYQVIEPAPGRYVTEKA